VVVFQNEKWQVPMSRGSILKSLNFPVISRELKILENAITALDLLPSIIDFAVNIGLRQTSEQWIKYLEKMGDMCADVYLESILTSNDSATRSARAVASYLEELTKRNV
jgi:hypothetical protein